MAQQGDGLEGQNNILEDIVATFNINDLQDFTQQDDGQQILEIENPTRVDVPEDNIFFELMEDFEGINNLVPQEQQEQQQQQQPYGDHYYQDEGEAIMAGLTGFGSGAATSVVTETKPPIDYSKVSVRIIEQPASHKLRFRYECEGRSAGALQGIHSTSDNKTYPTIKVEGYTGPAVVVVSCVDEKAPFRAHPHNLVGRGTICRKGVCSMEITNPDMTCQFANLGIQCVRKKDAPASLARREEIKVDPFRCGFAHKNGAINLNAIRLCFQVFLRDQPKLRGLPPVVSNVIYDKKSHSDLQIIEISDGASPVEGGRKILIFCEKVDKNDIEVHFTFTTKSGEPIVKKGEFAASDVHKQFGISFRTPPFPNLNITERVQVALRLYKPSDQSYSEPIDFYYIPALRAEVQPQAFKAEMAVTASQYQAERPKAEKRGRPPKQPDDTDSRVINPRKVSTPQYRGGGGQVAVVAEKEVGEIKPDPLRIPDLNNLWNNPNGSNNPMSLMDRMSSLPFHEVVARAANNPQFMNDLDAASRQQQQQQQQQNNDLNGLGGCNIPGVEGPIVGEMPSFPNLDLNSDDLSAMAMVDNLSSNISDLGIDRRTNTTTLSNSRPNQHLEQYSNYNQLLFLQQQQQQQQLQQQSGARPATGHGYHRQSSQLQTPDISMDESGQKRNNLNKF